MVDGLNFKDFVAFLSAFSAKASIEHKAGRKYPCSAFLLGSTYNIIAVVYSNNISLQL